MHLDLDLGAAAVGFECEALGAVAEAAFDVDLGLVPSDHGDGAGRVLDLDEAVGLGRVTFVHILRSERRYRRCREGQAEDQFLAHDVLPS